MALTLSQIRAIAKKFREQNGPDALWSPCQIRPANSDVAADEVAVLRALKQDPKTYIWWEWANPQYRGWLRNPPDLAGPAMVRHPVVSPTGQPNPNVPVKPPVVGGSTGPLPPKPKRVPGAGLVVSGTTAGGGRGAK